MPPRQATSRIHQLLDEHWTAALGVEPSVWRDAEVVVASHPEPTHVDHIYLILREETCIIVVPQALVGSTATACASWPSAAVFDRSFIRSLFGNAVKSVTGPAWLGYVTSDSFRRIDGRQTRPLEGTRDAQALARLLAACTQHERVDAGFEVEQRREYGCFVENSLVAAGTLTPFRGRLANLGALTHPQQRNQGFGTAVVSALTSQALADTSAAQFRALCDNLPALRVARVLGYVEDARTLEVVLSPDAVLDEG